MDLLKYLIAVPAVVYLAVALFLWLRELPDNMRQSRDNLFNLKSKIKKHNEEKDRLQHRLENDEAFKRKYQEDSYESMKVVLWVVILWAIAIAVVLILE